jgi:hypothetical protein
VARRLELARALGVAALSPALTRLSPERLARVLEPRALPAVERPDALAAVERALALTGRVLRHTCYTRGITRYYVLRRSGFDVSLVFGVEPGPEARDGHCWIVLDGSVYREAVDPSTRFVAVWTVGADS